MNNRICTLLAILMAFGGFSVSGQIPAGYYSTASGLTGSALKTALHNIIDNHTELSYTAVTNALRVTDEDPNNPNNVILIYTGWSYPKTAFGNLYNNWNREHVWAKSHGDFGDNPPEGTDLHHLRPCP
jgi:endonuclease I